MSPPSPTPYRIADPEARKPKALYFHWPLLGDPNPVRTGQEQEVLDRLEPHFEVVLVEDDGDYQQFLDRHQPDLALFESKAVLSRKPTISGARDDRSIPKVMLIRSDAGCHSRHELLRDVEDLGIDACFAIDSLYSFYYEEIKERLYYMPHSVDPAVFRDYGLPKSELIAFYGHFLPSRPWKIGAAKALRAAFPTTFHPHDTTRTNADTTRMVHGEAYARQLSLARFIPVEGAFHNMMTRKFVEVPAVRSALVAPRFDMLSQFGFVDMVNCVLGEPQELVDKIDYLLSDERCYENLVESGRRVVQDRHVHSCRSQLRDWYDAFKSAPAGALIRQKSIFGGFTTVNVALSGAFPPLAHPEVPIDHMLLERAERAIQARRLNEAETDLVTCMNLLYARHLLEPRFYLAIVRLLQGRASEAIFFLTSNFVTRGAKQGAKVLDPREAALLILAYLALGQRDKAAVVADVHADISHPDLGQANLMLHRKPGVTRRALSIFPRVPLADLGEWTKFARDVFAAHHVSGEDDADHLAGKNE